MKYILSLFLLILPSQVLAAIAFDSAQTALQNNAAVLTYSFNNVAGNFCAVVISPDADTVTSVTYNLSAMTDAGSHVFKNSRYQQIWYLENCPTGTHNVIITGGNDIYSRAISFSGVATGSSVSGYTTANGTGTTPSIAVTTSVANSFVIAGGQTDPTATAGANTTQMASVNAQLADIWYSTSAVSSPSSFTININASGGGAWGIVGFAISPPVVAVSPKSILGLLESFWIF